MGTDIRCTYVGTMLLILFTDFFSPISDNIIAMNVKFPLCHITCY